MNAGTTPPPGRRPHFGYTRHGLPVHLRTRDHLPDGTAYARFNKAAALLVTRAVGTMTTAYFFAAFDCLALPTAIRQGLYGIVQWTASFFLQLVLLSVIMVGQNLQASASDARAARTFEDAEAILGKIAGLEAKLDTALNGGAREPQV
jgi:hypothetical protein